MKEGFGNSPKPLGQRYRKRGGREWLVSEIRPTALGEFVDIEMLYGEEALLHVPQPPDDCPVRDSASGERSICDRCGESWSKGGQRACVTAYKVMTAASKDRAQEVAHKTVESDQQQKEAALQEELRAKIAPFLPRLNDATTGLIHVDGVIDLNDQWAGLLPWLTNVSRVDAKTSSISPVGQFINDASRFKIKQVKPFANFFSPEFVFGWAASVVPEGDASTGNPNSEMVLMGTFFKLRPSLDGNLKLVDVDLKPLHAFLQHWEEVKDSELARLA